MRVEIDDRSGFCFGVVGAIERAEELLAAGKVSGREVWSLGDIVHNAVEMRRLEELGLHRASHADMERLGGRTLLVRAHGEPPSTYRRAEALGIKIVDATCPVVARLQRLVVDAHRQMSAVGGQVVILGKKGHAEVVGLTGGVDGDALVVESEEDLEMIEFSRPVYLLSQTTQSLSLWRRIMAEIERRALAGVVANDTICRQVASREEQIGDFVRRFDAALFVSGRKSSNGKLLFEACLRANPRSHMIEEAGDIDAAWFRGVASVGVCGATSTPRWLMKFIGDHVAEMSC
ncbi:MAG: 4-hydroxy-3-methylbut-2-enyl diphosphate reductase [Rikenellaceae bacterium]|jgi:4-hydroxy-3-methylbut-2-enyl diphosphate reductase|nr:4-hydroxy-3-methylbut-2-enyl diphosphate reductase [Rikenellaceae bacterium]